MSLLTDPELLIHSLRLGYLRNIAEDPYGPRLISFNPSFSTNPYITAASLSDTAKWPELASPPSPPLSPDESDGDGSGSASGSRPRSISGFPGATKLKYTQTILGPSRTGALGMSVGGRRRSSDAKRLSSQTLSPESASARDGDGETTVVATTTTSYMTATSSTSMTTMTSKSPPRQEQQQQQPQVSTATDAAPPPKPVFVPKFKGAAEMDERRRLRLQARRGVAAAAAAAATSATPEIRIVAAQEKSATLESSGDEEDVEEEDSFMHVEDEDFDDVVDVSVSVDIDEDEFDPEFATTRLAGMISDSVSDGLSGVSASLSTSNSFNIPSSPPPLHGRSRARLSPVTEDKIPGGTSSASSDPDTRPSEPGFDMITVLHSRTSEHPQAAAAAAGAPHTTRSNKHRRTSHGTSSSSTAHPSSATATTAAAEEDLFARQKVSPIRAAKSALSSMMAASNTTNPFSDLYSAISGRGASPAASMVVTVFFPFAREPAGESMRLSVRKDATVEEVLGFGLWSYWEAGWLPRLDDEDINSNTSEEKLSAVGWVMKIAEDDGEVDEDFPPPNRESKISKFSFEAYAVLEANPMQVQQNNILEQKIQRSPSRVVNTKKADSSNGTLALPSVNAPSGSSASALPPSTLSNAVFPGSYNSSGPQIFLRIRIQDTADAAHLYTTISVSATMYMQEALEMVCRKRRLQPKEYALLLSDMSILIPLDRTVASLQGESDLRLVKRSMLPHMNVDVRPIGRSTDPNASIFKRMSDVPDMDYNISQDFTAAYKKYTVYRKMPMIVGKHERTLAIDGPYIHIMPTTNKAAKVVFDSGKTSSYHIDSVASCQSGKSSSAFRIVVLRDGGNKRYEFEAESAKLANEIVQTIKGLKSVLERTGSITGKSRRSKQTS